VLSFSTNRAERYHLILRSFPISLGIEQIFLRRLRPQWHVRLFSLHDVQFPVGVLFRIGVRAQNLIVVIFDVPIPVILQFALEVRVVDRCGFPHTELRGSIFARLIYLLIYLIHNLLCCFLMVTHENKVANLMLNSQIVQLSPRVLLYEANQLPANLPKNWPKNWPKNYQEGWIALPHVRDKAFGDGSHPTTRLCAGAVDLLCQQLARQNPSNASSPSVLDVGTGTAVLARIARARGAQFIVGTDIDPEALTSARTHIALDSNPTPIIISDNLPDHWGSRFDLAVANILEAPLRELASRLSKALAPQGSLLISGFTRVQVPGLRLAFEGQGLKFITESELDGWVMLLFRSEK
jgi:ribosomal protein L11 methylase PrmA